jgi:hypothetical protein
MNLLSLSWKRIFAPLLAAFATAIIIEILMTLALPLLGYTLQPLSFYLFHNDVIDVGFVLLCEAAVAFFSVLAAACAAPSSSRRMTSWVTILVCLGIYCVISNFLHHFMRTPYPVSQLYLWSHDVFLWCFTTGGVCGSLYVTLRHGKPLLPGKPDGRSTLDPEPLS